MPSPIIMKIRFIRFEEDDVGGSRVRSRARSHDYRSCDHGITIAFVFGVSFNKQVIVKNKLELDKKPPNPIGERRRKPMLL